MIKKLIPNQAFLDAIGIADQFDVGTLMNLIEQYYGERNELDFKEKLIEPHKLAKIMLAMANSGGGTIIFGINDNNEPIGLDESSLSDITEIESKLSTLLPQALVYSHQIIRYPQDEIYKKLSGKIFLIFYIPSQYRNAPFLAIRESNDLKKNRIYVRRNTSVEEATEKEGTVKNFV